MKERGRVVIAGCGYVGTALAERLAEAGDEVIGLRRSGGAPRSFASGGSVRFVAADLSDARSLARGCDGVDRAVFCAAADASTDASYRAAYIDGLRNFVGALEAARAPVGRLVFTSSTSVYAQTDGAWVDEESPTDPVSFEGARMLEAERIAHAAPFSAVVLRLGGIYGPGRTRLLDSVSRGEARLGAGAPRIVNRIHRDDCAGAAMHLLALEGPERVYLGVDSEPAELDDVLRFLARTLELPEPPREAEPPVSRGGSSKRCRNARLLASGYAFVYPTYREGYPALLRSQ